MVQFDERPNDVCAGLFIARIAMKRPGDFFNGLPRQNPPAACEKSRGLAHFAERPICFQGKFESQKLLLDPLWDFFQQASELASGFPAW